MSAKPVCWVFDLDDTLYLERDYVRSGCGAVERWLVERLPRDSRAAGLGGAAWRLFEEGTRGDLFNRALGAAGLDAGPGVVTDMVRVYRNHVPDISLAPDAATLLGAWCGHRPLALITDGPEPSQRAKINALGLTGRMDPAILTATLGEGRAKPAPHAFEQVMQAWPGCAYVYVGDNPAKDFAAPLALGWQTVRICRPHGLHAAVPNRPECPPCHEVEDLRQIEMLF